MVKKGFVAYLFNLNEVIIDILYILGSIGMTISHLLTDPFHIASKIIMILVILLSIIRTYKFMKIFSAFSPIVTMLQ